MKSLSKGFILLSILLIALGIVINIALGQLAIQLQLPIYLDSIGTVLAGVLAGPWVGAITGYLSNLVWTISGLFPAAVGFMPIAVIIGLLAGAFGSAGWMRDWWTAASAGLITGVFAAILSAPIAAYVFGGVEGTGTQAVVSAFRSFGLDALFSNLAQGTFSDPLDKAITFLIVWALLLVIPKWVKRQFSFE